MITFLFEESKTCCFFLPTMHLPLLLNPFAGPLILFEPGVHIFNIPTLLAPNPLKPLTDHILLLILIGLKLLLIHLIDFLHLMVFVHSLLIENLLCSLLYFSELAVELHLLTDFGLEDFLWGAGVDGGEAGLLSLVLFFGDGHHFEVVLFLVVGEPGGEGVVVLEGVAAVAGVDYVLAVAVAEHLLGDSQCLRKAIDIIILHSFGRNNLDLALLLIILFGRGLLLFLPLPIEHLPSLLHLGSRLVNHVRIIIIYLPWHPLIGIHLHILHPMDFLVGNVDVGVGVSC